MPIVPAHVKLARAKQAKAKASTAPDGEDESVKKVTEGISSVGITTQVADDAPSSENKVNAMDIDSVPPTSSTVFEAMNAGSVQQQPALATAPASAPVSTSGSAQKLVTRRALLYPMQGVQASENNDGMLAVADDEEGGNGNKGPVATVDFGILQQRNVSLAKGLHADENLEAAMGSVLLDVITENQIASGKSLDDAVRNFHKINGGGSRPAQVPQQQQRGDHNHSKHSSRGVTSTQGSASGGNPSANLKSLLKIAPGAIGAASGTAGGGQDTSSSSFNGGMNILDMLKNAKTVSAGNVVQAAAGGKKGGGGKGSGSNKSGANWQQEQLLRAQAQQQAQGKGKGNGNGGSSNHNTTGGNKAYEAKQQQQVKAYLKSTDGGKDVNYASSAAFNAPDVNDVPLPDFSSDMNAATFAKGGFFDT